MTMILSEGSLGGEPQEPLGKCPLWLSEPGSSEVTVVPLWSHGGGEQSSGRWCFWTLWGRAAARGFELGVECDTRGQAGPGDLVQTGCRASLTLDTQLTTQTACLGARTTSHFRTPPTNLTSAPTESLGTVWEVNVPKSGAWGHRGLPQRHPQTTKSSAQSSGQRQKQLHTRATSTPSSARKETGVSPACTTGKAPWARKY